MTCLESVQKKIDFKPEVALILGSGLGDFADGIKIEQTMHKKIAAEAKKDSQCLSFVSAGRVLIIDMTDVKFL